MGRKQAFTKSELLDNTKKLLLEYGYDGFTLKLLSNTLVGARSTIYQYYANKEEIVAACMKNIMENVLHQTSQVDETVCMEALQHLLTIYVGESKLHHLLSYVSKVNKTASTQVEQDLQFIEKGHIVLKDQLERLFVRAQKEGEIDSNLPLPAVIAVFFNLIEAPNMMNLPTTQWSELLFKIWLGGIGRK